MRRDAGLDLVKWLAMLSMLIDHLRYLWPDAYGLFIIGRLAFPLFCLSIAANVTRTRPGELFSEGNARYLGWLLVFSLISELPYRELSPESATLNVMPTLLLGLLVAWGVHHADRNSLLLATGYWSAGPCDTFPSSTDVRLSRCDFACCLYAWAARHALVVAACRTSHSGQQS